MRRVLLITVSLILALAGWNMVCAEDGFYVISGVKLNYAPVPKTGQILTYAPKDDGNLKKGVTSPTPRFTDNGNGTVTDKLSGLIWMKNANAFGQRTWTQAMSDANGLKSGSADLADGSEAGDWRLANLRELQSLADYSKVSPALPENHPFTGVMTTYYWTSTTYAYNTDGAWTIGYADGYASAYYKTDSYYVWCVRGGP
jgi:hypothetical protein